MAFKVNNKDEVPASGKRLYNVIDDKTGAIISQNVRLVRSNTNTQVGDVFGAMQLNEIGKRFNDLEDGTKAVKKASILVGNNASKNGIMTRWEGTDRGVIFDVDNDKDLPVDNSMRLNGAKLYSASVVVDPGGKDTANIPIPKEVKNVIYFSAINSNALASRSVVGCTALNNGQLVFVFTSAVSGSVQISYMILYT